MCLGIFDGRVQNVAVPQHTALFRGCAMYMMVLHCNALVGTMYKLSYIGPHQQLAPLCGPYSMALAYSCNDSGTSVHQIDSPRWFPNLHASQPASQAPSSRSLPACQAIQKSTLSLMSDSLTVRPLKQGHFQPSLLFT